MYLHDLIATMFWCRFRSKHFFDLLLPKGGKINFLCDFPVRTDMSIFGYSQKKIDYHEAGQTPRLSPLTSAVGQGQFDLVKDLLKTGRADVNYPDEDGKTALMYAVRMVSIYHPSYRMYRQIFIRL